MELSHCEKLQQELAQKNEFLSSEIEVYKVEATQAFLVGFGITVEQASSLYLKVDFSQLAPGKVVVDGELREG